MGRIMMDDMLRIQGCVFIGPLELRGPGVVFDGNEIFGSLEVDTDTVKRNQINNNRFHDLVDLNIWKRLNLCWLVVKRVWALTSKYKP